MQLRRRTATCGSWAAFVGMVGLPLLLTSCGSSEPRGGPRHPTVPVQGEISINGKPAQGIFVKLHPDKPLEKISESRATDTPYAATDKDGVFKIMTYEADDGAPVNTYKISLKASGKPPGAGFSKGVDSIDRFDGKYADHEKNAEDDPEHFTVDVKPQPDGSPIVIPKIEIQLEGFDAPEEKKEE